jgi:hypothetical protein
MRQRTLLDDTHHDGTTPARPYEDTYERVRRTLDEALAELQMPLMDIKDDSGRITLRRPNLR